MVDISGGRFSLLSLLLAAVPGTIVGGRLVAWNGVDGFGDDDDRVPPKGLCR
jgi:hypothetical protein